MADRLIDYINKTDPGGRGNTSASYWQDDGAARIRDSIQRSLNENRSFSGDLGNLIGGFFSNNSSGNIVNRAFGVASRGFFEAVSSGGTRQQQESRLGKTYVSDAGLFGGLASGIDYLRNFDPNNPKVELSPRIEGGVTDSGRGQLASFLTEPEKDRMVGKKTKVGQNARL